MVRAIPECESDFKEGKVMKKCMIVLSICLSLVVPAAAAAKDILPNQHKAKNVIFMVPDGMGLAYVTAARTYIDGSDGAPLSFETLPVIGYQRTHSANSFVTDSAAAASAWSCGEKFNNGEICYHSADGTYPDTILELARDMGKATGLIATSRITHATPAAYGAHVPSRNCENAIATDMVTVTQPDVILGGGARHFDGSNPVDGCGGSSDNLPAAFANGYEYVETYSDLLTAISGGVEKVIGLFTLSHMPPHLSLSPDLPSLAEMSTAALDILEENKDGFFIMIEGSQIDWAGHANDPAYQVGEMMGFNEAVKAVLDWINESPSRVNNTLLVVVADHETGGYAIDGPYGSQAEEGVLIQDGWTSTNHSAVDTIIWSQGPGSQALGAALDNTDLYGIILEAME
jgi:alkaline phosphatase